MNPCTFVSSWVPGFHQSTPTSSVKKCSTRPRMSLVSHEKVEVLFSSENTELAKYKLELEIPGQYSKDKRKKSIQSLKQNSHFKGFRKGTIPPFIMKDIPPFVLRDSVEEMLQSALKELDLEATDGEASEPDMDIEEMMKTFKVGIDFTFTVEMPLRKIISLDGDSITQDIIDVKTDAVISDAETDAKRMAAEAEAKQASS